MNAAQILAFNHASGTQVTELNQFIILVLFVVVCFWALFMFIGKMKVLITLMRGEMDYPKFAFEIIRILAVMAVILILIH